MKVYYNLWSQDFSPQEFVKYMAIHYLKTELGIIQTCSILERKTLSNKGNALEGSLRVDGSAYTYGMNIGGNPIGTGHGNYIPFLEEMGCSKVLGLYQLDSMIGKSLILLMSHDWVKGYITPSSFMELGRI